MVAASIDSSAVLLVFEIIGTQPPLVFYNDFSSRSHVKHISSPQQNHRVNWESIYSARELSVPKTTSSMHLHLKFKQWPGIPFGNTSNLGSWSWFASLLSLTGLPYLSLVFGEGWSFSLAQSVGVRICSA
jgi:hypothetical protein